MDLNNLISTIISATAALVAIIGGFLVSRLITLSSEKNAIVRRLREIDNKLTTKEKILDGVELILLEYDVDDFIAEHAQEILIEEKSIESILENDDSVFLTKEELKPYIECLYKIYDNLINMLENTDYDYNLPRSFNNFIKDNHIKIDKKKDWYKIVYMIIYNNLLSEQTNHPVLKLGLKPINYKFHNISTAKWYNEKVKERNNLKDEVRILSGMKKEQEKILREYGNVSELWKGILVLAYSTIVGIVIPILLPYPLDKYDDTATRNVLLLLFFSGLASLFIYLGVSMYKLTRDE